MSNKSRTLCIFLGILALIVLGAYGFILLRIRSKVGDLSAFEAQADEQQTYAADNHSLEQLLADTKPDIDSLSTHFVSSDGTVPFIESVEALAKSKGMSITVSSIAAVDAPTSGFSLMNVTLATSGSWTATYAFLKALETMPYQIDVTSVTLNQGAITAKAGDARVPSAAPQTGWNALFAFSVLQQKQSQ